METLNHLPGRFRAGFTMVEMMVTLGILAVGLLAMLMLQSAKNCPACFNETISIRRPILARVLPMAEWRWCPTCEWHGDCYLQHPVR